jgi:hypothetical protein
MVQVSGQKEHILGPAAFAVLEGLLRRKNSRYVTKDGVVLTDFTVHDSGAQPKTYFSSTPRRLNAIDDSLRLFAQRVVVDRGRSCAGFDRLQTEIETFWPKSDPKDKDAFDMIGSWRNELVHGKGFWTNRVPVLLNMICLLAIDELGPDEYNSLLAEFAKDLKHHIEVKQKYGYPMFLFPLDPG